jgi:hypothetical protein
MAPSWLWPALPAGFRRFSHVGPVRSTGTLWPVLRENRPPAPYPAPSPTRPLLLAWQLPAHLLWGAARKGSSGARNDHG